MLRSPHGPLLVARMLLIVACCPALGQQPAPLPERAPAARDYDAQDRQRLSRARWQAWDNSHRLYAQGKLAEAIDAGEEALRLDRELLGQNPDEDVANLLRWLGRLHVERENFVKARKAWNAVINVATMLHGAADPTVVDAKWELADVDRIEKLAPAQRQGLVQARRSEPEIQRLQDAGLLLDALAKAEQVLRTRQSILGRDHPETAWAMQKVGLLHAKLHDVEEATEAFSMAADIRKATLGPGHPLSLESLTSLANILDTRADDALELGDYADARGFRQRAVDVRLAMPDTPRWEITDEQRAIRLIEKLQTRTPEQIRQYRDALELERRRDLLSSQGRVQEAADLARKCADLFRSSLGDEDSRYWRAMQSLARITDRIDPDAADELWKNSLEIPRKALGDNDPSYLNFLADDVERRAWRAKMRDDWDEDLRLLEEAVSIRRRSAQLGGNAYSTAGLDRTSQDLAFIRRMTRLTPELRALMRQAEEHANKGLALAAEQDYGNAMVEHRKALALRKRVKAEGVRADLTPQESLENQKVDDRLIAVEIQDIARMCLRQGDCEKAVENCRKALELWIGASGPGDRRTEECRLQLSNALLGLANDLEDREQWTAALAAAHEALQIQSRIYSPGAETLRSTELIVDFHERLATMSPDQREQLRQSEKIVRESERLDAQRNTAAAIPWLQEALALRLKIVGKPDERYLDLLRRQAAMHQDLANYRACADCLTRAASICRDLYGAGDNRCHAILKSLLLALRPLRQAADEARDWRQSVLVREQLLAIKTELFGQASWQATEERLDLAQARRRADFTGQQSERCDRAQQLLEQARKLARDPGSLRRAIPLFEQAMQVDRELLGEDLSYADLAEECARLHRSDGDERRANQLEQDAYALRLKLVGPRHPDVAMRRCGQFARQREEALNRHDLPAARRAAHDLLALLVRWQRRDWQFTQCRDMLDFIELLQRIGPDQRKQLFDAREGLDLARRLAGQRKFPEAIAQAQGAADACARIVGRNSFFWANAAEQCGILCFQGGDLGRAEPLLSDALHCFYDTIGPQSPVYAQALHWLGKLYCASGDRAAGMSCFQDSFRIRIDLADSTRFASSADLDWVVDDLRAGYADLLQVISEQLLDPFTPPLSDAQRDEDLHAIQSYTALMNRFKGERPDMEIEFRTLLGRLALSIGDFKLAGEHFTAARDLARQIAGPASAVYARGLMDLGRLCSFEGKYDQARQYLEQARALYKDQGGIQALQYARTLCELAWTCEAAGRTDEAQAVQLQAMEVGQQALRRAFALASEPAMAGFLRDISPDAHLLFSIGLDDRPGQADRVEAALTWALRRKTLILNTQSQARRMIAAESADPEVASRLARLRDLRARLAGLAARPPAGWSARSLSNLANDLGDEIDRLEADLASLLSARTGAVDPWSITASQVRAKLGREAALVDFARVHLADFKAAPGAPRWTPMHYIAFVLPGDPALPPRLIDLGEAKPIEDAVEDFRQAVTAFKPGIDDEKLAEAAFLKPSSRLYALVFAKLAPALGSAKLLYVGPDAQLSRIPFEALSSDPQHPRYLVEEGYRFAYVASGQDLLRVKAPPGEGTIVIADPDYGAGAADREALARQLLKDDPRLQTVSRGVHPTVRGGRHFKPLPATSQEARDIESALAGTPYGPVRPFTGAKALRALFLSLKSPRILHVATHGYFDPDPAPDARPPAERGPAPPSPGGRTGAILASNPLLRCGLALAGANVAADPATVPGNGQPDDDGLVTAEEICTMDLRGTELVVLSACESGLGAVRVGQGVYGLRWAFLNAGARTLITSLFEVPDTETRQLMRSFYGALKSGKEKLAALHDAQLAQIKLRRAHSGAAHPFYWAGFILVGDPE